MSELLDPLFTSVEMAELFSDRGRLQGMLDFEAALARAEARAGIIPEFAVAAISVACRAELIDEVDLGHAAARAGNLAIPLVRQLTDLAGVEAGRYVHWGATSQDVIDSGLVIQLRAALALFERDLGRLAVVLAGLADRHRATVLAGRTLMQQAQPVTLGLKVAGWLDAVLRQRARLAELRPRLLVVQLGGAAGTLAALGTEGPRVAALVAGGLRLGCPDLPWHGHRDRLAELAAVLGLLTGTLGKIARDISLLMQTEVAEAFEPTAPGRGGSSTMPHKHNPVGCAVALAAATRVPALVATMLAAMVQEHERGLGGWHAEWETLPEICRVASGALGQMIAVLGGLRVDAERMRANLEASGGQIFAAAIAMALAPALGARPAHDLVERACAQAAGDGRTLRQVVESDPTITARLTPADLDRLFDPAGACGMAEAMVERVLDAHRRWEAAHAGA